MHLDIASLLSALMVNIFTMAVALPAVMGQVSEPARRAQAGVALQAGGWALLLASTGVAAGGALDLALSSLSMASLAGSMALMARAFELWCGRVAHDRMPVWIAVAVPVGYAFGFSNYAFRVGWANGLLALQMVMVAVALGRRPSVPVGRWRWLLVLSLLAQALVTGWRGVLGGFFTESYPRFLAPHPVNLAFAAVANATAVLTMVGVLLAHRDEAARALERLATLDGLTGAFNRRAWLARAASEVAVAVRYDRPLLVLMMDLDHFKAINDAMGHEAGDRALQWFTAELQAAMRVGDIAGRYGGEEFCVLMNHADGFAAQAFDRRLRGRLAAAESELGFALDYSAGFARRNVAGDTVEAMIRRADETLYRAKAAGRGRTLDENDRSAPPPFAAARPALTPVPGAGG